MIMSVYQRCNPDLIIFSNEKGKHGSTMIGSCPWHARGNVSSTKLGVNQKKEPQSFINY